MSKIGMPLWADVHPIKSDDLSSIPRAHMVQEKNDSEEKKNSL